MGKINGENLWGKFMGKINEKKLWGKLMVLFPLAVIKEMGIKYMGIFNSTYSHNGNGKKYLN